MVSRRELIYLQWQRRNGASEMKKKEKIIVETPDDAKRETKKRNSQSNYGMLLAGAFVRRLARLFWHEMFTEETC